MRNLLKAVLIASIIVVGIRLFTVENKGNLEDFEISKRDFPVSKYIANLFEDYEKRNSPVRMLSGASVRISRNKQYVCVYYGLGVGGYEDTEAIYSTVYFKVYNAKGKQIGEIEFFDRAGGCFQISENGDFIGSQFRKVDDDLVSHRGYMVVEISSGRIVTEDFPPKDTDYSVSGCAKHPDYNQMFFNMKSIDIYYSFTYDFENKKTYSKKFLRNDIRFKKRLKDGIIRKAKYDNNETEFVPFTVFETKEWDIEK